MNIETYLRSIPKLHKWSGKWHTGGFDSAQLRTIYEFLRTNGPQKPTIVETGAGNSTLCFLHLNPERLVSIAPDQDLFDRIDAYCREHDIATDGLLRYADGSQWVLPTMARESGGRFDFALIDGNHNWPMVMVDYYYVNVLVKRGGFIMVDDVQLHSVKELARLLASDPANFRIRANIGKALIFEKLTDQREMGGWWTQPYITAMTDAAQHDPYALGLWRLKPSVWVSKALMPFRSVVGLTGRVVSLLRAPDSTPKS